MKNLLFTILAMFAFSAPAFAQSTGAIRKKELERVKIQDIPLAGYDEVKAGDAAPITEAAYTYNGEITAIRDADTVRGSVDVGFYTKIYFDYRYFGIDSFEITRKGGRSKSHTERGYYCRDLMVKWLGSDEVFPKKATYQEFKEPIPIIVQSVKADKYAGRWLFIIHKDGVNLNQLAARSGCSIVTTFGTDPVYFARDKPITPNLK